MKVARQICTAPALRSGAIHLATPPSFTAERPSPVLCVTNGSATHFTATFYARTRSVYDANSDPSPETGTQSAILQVRSGAVLPLPLSCLHSVFGLDLGYAVGSEGHGVHLKATIENIVGAAHLKIRDTTPPKFTFLCSKPTPYSRFVMPD
jgi:hypothetical protein